MSVWLTDVLADLRRAEQLQQVVDALAHHLGRFGYTRLIYAVTDGSEARAISNMPSWWLTEYKSRGYARVDPFFRYCCRSYQRTFTGSRFLKRYAYLHPEEHGFVLQASDTGFLSGVAIPVGLLGEPRSGGWNIGGDLSCVEVESQWLRYGSEIRATMLHAHAKIQALQPNLRTLPSENSRRSLTGRERDCLIGLARGLQLKEIAAKLGIAYGTVELYLRSARRKLGARTREEALAISLHLGLIRPFG